MGTIIEGANTSEASVIEQVRFSKTETTRRRTSGASSQEVGKDLAAPGTSALAVSPEKARNAEGTLTPYQIREEEIIQDTRGGRSGARGGRGGPGGSGAGPGPGGGTGSGAAGR